ncbi:MAG: TPM domain-containing protein [bacterium]
MMNALITYIKKGPPCFFKNASTRMRPDTCRRSPDSCIRNRHIRYLVICLISCVLVLSMSPLLHSKTEAPFPEPQGYVTDRAGLLTPQSAGHLQGLIAYIHQKTTAEVAVVTLESIAPYTIEDYAVRLFEKWGIGQKEKDNGVLLLIAVRERKIRIEVGYGLEGAITDGTAGEIIHRIISPAFKEGHFEQGLVAGTEAILRLIANEYQLEMPEGLSFKTPPMGRPKASSGVSDLLIVFLSIFVLFILFKTGLWPLLFFGFPFGGGGWSGGRGGFSGGFGGFGGGLSGGGGASGGW